MTSSDQSLLLECLGALGDLPSFSLGDPTGRYERLVTWKVGIETLLDSTPVSVSYGWRWAWGQAEHHYRRWVPLTLPERNRYQGLSERAPPLYVPIKSWIYMRFLETIHVKVKEEALRLRSYGQTLRVGLLLFEVM